MIKHYLLFAKWRKKDVEFLNSLKLDRLVEEGYFGIPLEEGEVKKKILEHYSKKDSLFQKTKPSEFSLKFQSVTFSKKELDNAGYYALNGIFQKNNGYPEPQNSLKYEDIIFKYDNKKFRVNKTQIAPFSVKKPKWNKTQKGFSLEWEFEFAFFKKEFYQEVLAPLGLQAMDVLDYKTGKPLEDTVQLIIPTAKSKLLLERSAYDIHPLSETGGYKQYALQTLDFFPPFEKKIDFHICYSQEELLRGHRKIIISKEFCDLLVKHNIIEYTTHQLTPLKHE
ncbi:hypothetical protein [Tenacibaculum sp.]|uniref:hypothetical protein n=1 Tax=Tenacibaculum sp. TaxID=1906242 RepID=UPI003AA8DA88